MFVEVKHVYNCNLYNLILHKYSPPHIYIYIVVLNIYANIVFILTNNECERFYIVFILIT